MTLYLKWFGFDYGQCIMDPSGLRGPLTFNDIMKEVGRPEEIAERLHRYRRLKEKYLAYTSIKEGHRDEILSFVFDGDEEAMRVFSRKEQEEWMPGDGLEEALQYLRSQGIICDVVAELKKTMGPIKSETVIQFLERRELTKYFDYFYSPQGRLDFRDNSTDFTVKGKEKATGEMYDYILEELARRGIKVEEAAMIGDKISTDIEQPRKRGFHTIQYTGYIDMGSSEYAEYKIKNFRELKELVKGVGR